MAKDLELILLEEGVPPPTVSFGPPIPLHEALRKAEESRRWIERMLADCEALLAAMGKRLH